MKKYGFCPTLKKDLAAIVKSLELFSKCRINDGKMPSEDDATEINELLKF
jgi:hypothetical protein